MACAAALRKGSGGQGMTRRFTKRQGRVFRLALQQQVRQSDGILVRSGDAVADAAEAIDGALVAQKPQRRRQIQRYRKTGRPSRWVIFTSFRAGNSRWVCSSK